MLLSDNELEWRSLAFFFCQRGLRSKRKRHGNTKVLNQPDLETNMNGLAALVESNTTQSGFSMLMELSAVVRS